MSKKQSPEDEKLITVIGKADEKLATEYGFITFREWLEREAIRFLRTGTRTRIVTVNGGVALSRD